MSLSNTQRVREIRGDAIVYNHFQTGSVIEAILTDF